TEDRHRHISGFISSGSMRRGHDVVGSVTPTSPVGVSHRESPETSLGKVYSEVPGSPRVTLTFFLTMGGGDTSASGGNSPCSFLLSANQVHLTIILIPK